MNDSSRAMIIEKNKIIYEATLGGLIDMHLHIILSKQDIQIIHFNQRRIFYHL